MQPTQRFLSPGPVDFNLRAERKRESGTFSGKGIYRGERRRLVQTGKEGATGKVGFVWSFYDHPGHH